MAFLKDISDHKKMNYAIGKREHAIIEGAEFYKELDKMYQEKPEQKKASDIDEEDSWWEFYYNSELRKGLFSWYPFEKEKTLLEIGGECGALTGLFCDKCKNVTVVEEFIERAEVIQKKYRYLNNLEIVCCEYDKLMNGVIKDKFDYIILNRVFERLEGINVEKLAMYLFGLIEVYLKQNGKILLVADNRYGIRNFCGARDVLTGKPFDGINKYPEGNIGYVFGRQELIRAINLSGIETYKFFYPLPDYRVTQIVCSDSYMVKNDIRDRIIFYEPFQDSLVALENDLYEDIIDNKALPFLSNSFLVECCIGCQTTDVDYVTVSEDRGRERGMMTAIMKNGTVKKKALYPQGERALLQLISNLNVLENRGFEVIPCKYEKPYVIMPYIDLTNFSIYLVETAKRSKEEFLSALKMWYRDIIRSSDIVEDKLCSPYFRKIPKEKRGVILEQGFLDLIPMNCFGNTNRRIYFDQEFVEKFIPAKYIFFRGIKYLFQAHKRIKETISLSEIKVLFELNEVWEVFEDYEKSFIEKIRNTKENSLFYRWTKYNRKEIYKRAEILEYQGEKVYGHIITPSTKIQQRIQLELLQILLKICKENNLRIFMFYGSLLGTVRHSGYIPWDDDLDVVMPREDYDQLIKISDTVFKYPYFLQTPENDKEVFYGGYAKLRHSGTTALEPRNWGHSCNQGIWIDIFPLDVCYKNKENSRKRWERIHAIQKMIFACTYSQISTQWEENIEVWNLIREQARQFGRDYWCEKLQKELHTNWEESPIFLSIQTRYTERVPLEFWKEDFADQIWMKFEEIKVPVPIGYHRCLEILNGKRYMVYPKIENCTPHHKGFFSSQTPYIEYVDKFNIGSDLSSIVLVGECAGINYFCKKFTRKLKNIFYIPELTDRSCEVEFGQKLSFKNELKLSNRKVIICAKRFPYYEEQLSSYGINNYKIYLSNPQHLIQK